MAYRSIQRRTKRRRARFRALAFEPAQVYQKALFEAGIPATAFLVDDINKEFERLKGLDVVFSMQPTQMGPVKLAVFNDTCGNNIQIFQVL